MVWGNTTKTRREFIGEIGSLLVIVGSSSLFLVLDWSECSAVERMSEKVSGAWVFTGTRVPVQALFANLEDGARVDDFLEWFPGVTREQVEALLRRAKSGIARLAGTWTAEELREFEENVALFEEIDAELWR
jgi:uncharacterized protein (DUF433 family)